MPTMYVLLFISTVTSGQTLTSVEFKSQQSCEDAKAALVQKSREIYYQTDRTHILCVPK